MGILEQSICHVTELLTIQKKLKEFNNNSIFFSSCMETDLSDLSKDDAFASIACSKVCKQQIYQFGVGM